MGISFIFWTLFVCHTVSAKTISFHHVSKSIYENIDIVHVVGPTPENTTVIKLKNGLSLAEQPLFDKNQITVFYLHGWGGLKGLDYTGSDGLITAFLQKKDVNIAAFNYSCLVQTGLVGTGYIGSAKNVSHIGKAIGQFLKAYIPKKQPLNLIRLISHSLGSQIMSQAAKTYRAGKLRLTALDPAGPLFNIPFISKHLKASDGSFVDVIHSDGSGYGDVRAVGTADFYPNGGKHQPGCDFEDIDKFCSHKRSWQLYAESILNQEAFLAKRCNRYEEPNKCNDTDITHMGYNVNTSAKGNYYLKTASKPPYNLDEAGLQF